MGLWWTVCRVVGLLVVLAGSLGRAQEPHQTPVIGKNRTKCYDQFNRPLRCIPGFENAAFDVLMEATNTCGTNGEMRFCVQTGIGGSMKKSCDICGPNDHDARHLTDFHSQDNTTWWQSETMYEGINYPNQVNLTLNLRKAFDITYLRLWFFSPRPESFAIYKRTTEDGPWLPYQFYSASCRDTYDRPDSAHTIRGEETRALCTSEYSDISPLRGGNVAFSTLEGRPSAYNFDTSPELQEWVTATDIKITLDRLNTFGDEIFGDEQVLRSYYYALADVAVGARCKCNGHASECVASTGLDGYRRRVCKCEHNTAGPDCNVCLEFYNDAPWGRASAKDAHECKQCNCNGYSNRCFFDEELYKRTGHGGHCMDCTANRDGPNCERCRENYYQREDQYCIACNCDPVGSRNLQCNREGRCQCKPGVMGDKCDRCDANHYDFGPQGCKICGCSEAGSYGNRPNCDPYSGTCSCKENVEGKRCRECKPGYFNLDLENDFGCTPCFCYGHSSECYTAPGYSRTHLHSTFARGNEKWKAEDESRQPVDIAYNGITQSISVSSTGYEAIFFLTPDRYLGDQRASYNQLLSFSLHIGEPGPVPTAADIVLEGSGKYVANTIFAQGNRLPTIEKQVYKFRLHEHPDFGWQPRLSSRAFQSILTNLTAIKIRGTYVTEGKGFLNEVKLETALRGAAGVSANWVERCDCPEGYVGQFCESCAPGYRHSPALGGPFMPCTPCDCNKHADICDSETGKCICQHNTAGDNCELCARGYYGNALDGSVADCQPCGCPEGGACIQLDDTIICVECPLGYTGHRCDSCSDGYFGDPTGRYGHATPCIACDCNLNIDPNAVGNCNSTTGECLKCIHYTGGIHCDECLSGYFGDALSLPKGDCEPCRCYHPGTEEGEDGIAICDRFSGTCQCRPHVQGKNCDECEPGYYNIMSEEGCQSCDCNPVGSANQSCDVVTGQCTCRPGITGQRCDRCEAYKYGFSSNGCTSCDCDRIGSQGLQCDAFGQCPCLENVEGRQCERCKENKYDRKRGCVDCPDCYNLVQDAAREHLAKLDRLSKALDEIDKNPTVIDDEKFEDSLKDLKGEIEDLMKLARIGAGGDDKTLSQKLDDIRDRQKQISRTLGEIEENIDAARETGAQGQKNVTAAMEIIKQCTQELQNANDIITGEGKIALEKARQRANEFGQQSEKMTKIAHEAREKANELEEHSKNIKEVAAQAKNISNKAHDMAIEATNQQNKLTVDLKNMKNEVGATQDKLKRIKQWTQEAHNKSVEAKNNALAILNEVTNLIIPEVDIPHLKKETDEIKKEAYRLLNLTDSLLNNNDEVLAEIEEQVQRAKDLLERAQEQQDITNEMLSDIDLSRARAEKAVDLGDKTLNDAKDTYNLLSDFDREVRESKESAEEALQKIPEIERLIDEALHKTDSAQQSLSEAEQTAQKALKTAVKAQDFAQNVSKDAAVLQQEMELLSANATKLRDEAGFMADRVRVTANDLKYLQEQTRQNETLISEAKNKVGQAETDSVEASKQVDKILNDVRDIMHELNSLPDIDNAELDRLEEALANAEQKIKDAQLDAQIEQLQKERSDQNALIKSYNEEIERLRLEVENVANIANALPQGCFKRLQLEP